MFLHVWDYFLDFCNILYSQITLLGFCIGYIRTWTFLKYICDYEINYKFHLSPLEAAKKHSSLKKCFVCLVEHSLRPKSGFNLIFSHTRIYFLRYYSEHPQNLCISWIIRSWELLNLFRLFWLWFPFENRGYIHSILLFVFSSIFLSDLL